MCRTRPVRWPRDRTHGPRRARSPQTAGRQPRRRLPRRAGRGDPRARRRTPTSPRRAAHRLGQVSGLLRHHDAAPGRRRRPHAHRLAAARPDARPDRCRRAGRDPRRHHELVERDGVGGRTGGAAHRLGRPAAGEPRAAQQPRASASTSCRTLQSAAACWSSTRPTASATGVTTSGRTTGASRTFSPSCPLDPRARDHRHRQRAGQSRTSPNSSAWVRTARPTRC